MVLNRLQLEHELDDNTWTTGARRSTALAKFRARPGESDMMVRQRMHKLAFAEGQTTVGSLRLVQLQLQSALCKECGCILALSRAASTSSGLISTRFRICA